MTEREEYQLTSYFLWTCVSLLLLGGGTIPPGCPVNYTRYGLLCYEDCPTNYKRWGFDCHQECPSFQWIDDGLFCRLKGKVYGRGWGYTGEAKCENEEGSGADGNQIECEKCGAFWYPKCQDGYKNDGCNLCAPHPDCKDLGMNGRVFSSCAKKIEIGSADVGECDDGDEIDGGLCYKKCKDGFIGRGPVCWAKVSV